MLQTQKYSVATMLATNSYKETVRRIRWSYEQLGEDPSEMLEFAEKINPLYKKRDGFVPKKVLDLIQF